MKTNENRLALYFSAFLGFGLMIFLTYDIIITNILTAYYCNTAPNPKTKIEKKVEYPISIYWEDNVYPGFSKADRELMIINYLDGVHLKTMALNAPDGKIYIYHIERPILKKLKEEFSESEWYSTGIKQYTQTVMQTQKVYTKQTMPKTNYTVTFNEVRLNAFTRDFLYSDETKVIENNTSKVIAYNRRYMRFFYTLQPDFQGGNYYYPHPMCGNGIYRRTEDKVFSELAWHYNVAEIPGINQKLYNKYIKGEK